MSRAMIELTMKEYRVIRRIESKPKVLVEVERPTPKFEHFRIV